MSFTKEQFEVLIKTVFLGNWMANADRKQDQIQKFNDLESYIYEQAGDFGLEHLVMKGSKRMVSSSALETDEEVDQIREEYDNNLLDWYTKQDDTNN